MLSAILFPVIWVIQLCICAVVIWLTGRWMKSPKASLFRAFGVVIVVIVYSMIGSMMMVWLFESLPPNQLPLTTVFAVLILLAVLFFSTLFIKFIFQLRTLRSIVVLVGYIAGCGITILVVLFLITPFVMKAYIVSSNSMAPTLVAEHRIAS